MSMSRSLYVDNGNNCQKLVILYILHCFSAFLWPFFLKSHCFFSKNFYWKNGMKREREREETMTNKNAKNSGNIQKWVDGLAHTHTRAEIRNRKQRQKKPSYYIIVLWTRMRYTFWLFRKERGENMWILNMVLHFVCIKAALPPQMKIEKPYCIF